MSKCPYCPAEYSTLPEMDAHLGAVDDHLRERLAESEASVDTLMDALGSARRERDEALAWKQTVIAEAVRWAERDVAPMLIGDLQNYVAASSYDERTRSLHLAAGAVKALQTEVETVLRNAAAGERARLAQKLRVEYPLNGHAQEWANWILRDSVEQKSAT